MHISIQFLASIWIENGFQIHSILAENIVVVVGVRCHTTARTRFSIAFTFSFVIYTDTSNAFSLASTLDLTLDLHNKQLKWNWIHKPLINANGWFSRFWPIVLLLVYSTVNSVCIANINETRMLPLYEMPLFHSSIDLLFSIHFFFHSFIIIFIQLRNNSSWCLFFFGEIYVSRWFKFHYQSTYIVIQSPSNEMAVDKENKQFVLHIVYHNCVSHFM